MKVYSPNAMTQFLERVEDTVDLCLGLAVVLFSGIEGARAINRGVLDAFADLVNDPTTAYPR
jgi:hypothetical protein